MTRQRIRQLWRIAACVRHQAVRACAAQAPDPLPRAAWLACRRLERLARAVQQRGWAVGQPRVAQRLARSIGDCRQQLQATEESLGDVPARPATTREIFDDLVALEADFCQVKIDLNAKQISVLTEAVVLDGVALGQFDIGLAWSELARRSDAYGIEGVNSNPASCDDDVIHQNVRDGALCAGDAQAAIAAALASGRLWDFFTVVAQTLANYNPHSAFVTLDRWQGVTCADCGDVTDDDVSSCEVCECDLCCHCRAGCENCGQSICGDCSKLCTSCLHGHCRDCLNECSRCRQSNCERCIADELCNNCREAAPGEQHSPVPSETPAAVAPAAVDPLCVGQAGVSA